MSTAKGMPPRRPAAVIEAAIVVALTGIFILLVFLCGGLSLLTMPLTGPRNSVVCTRGLGVVCIVGGVLAAGMILRTAWNFYHLNPSAYHAVKATTWRPQFWLVTRFGKRLDEPAVRSAFGLAHKPTRSEILKSPSPDDVTVETKKD